MNDFDEEKELKYQATVLKWFQDVLGYQYLGNLKYAKGQSVNSQGTVNSPILEDKLTSYLKGAGYTDMQITDAVRRLKEAARLSDRKFVNLLDTNNRVYELLVSGISSKPSPDENDTDISYFNFKEPEKNDFYVAEEVTFIDPLTTSNCRPDIVVYVNGIAICVIELKRSIISLEEGIKQSLSNEQDLIPSFFTTTQFTVAARHASHLELAPDEEIEDGMHGFKYGTIGTPLQFWCPWKYDTNKTGIVLSDEEAFLAFFKKEDFMFRFRYGVLSDGGIKKVMRPHQYHALRAAEPRLKTKDSGVIWHSQGSGKSLTMVWLAAYIKANFDDPRVLVITDRTELDVQLSGDFGSAGNNLHQATSQLDLLQTLQDGKEWLITTLIHKFGKHSKQQTTSESNSTRIPLDRYLRELQATIHQHFPYGFKAKGSNIFIFVDECHRTQGGRLHDAMRAIMGQSVMLIGFTGTPLLKEEKKTGYNAFRNLSETKFGTFIHKYLHKQAVEDKVILDLQYSAREVEQTLGSKDQVDKKLEQITKGLSKERVELIKERWSTLEKVYSSSDRIERIGYSILDDMETNSILRQDWANAMLVAGNIYSAYKYYDFFQNRSSNTRLRDHVAVVTSYSPTDYDLRKKTTNVDKESQDKFKHDMAVQSFLDAGLPDKQRNADKYEAWAKNLFINQPGRLKLLIVVDKLLTGFDAPCATFLYIDKEMRDHTLFQAICRINRLGTDVKDEEGNLIAQTHKEYGIIVDFKHLFGNIKDSVTKFNDVNGGLGGYDEEDIEGLLDDNIAKNKKRLLAADKAFCALKAKWISQGLTNNDLLAEDYIKDRPDDPAVARRTALYKITGQLTASYDNMADFMSRAGFTVEEADYYEHQAREAATINAYVKQRSGDVFDPHFYDPDMRALLDRFIRAEDAEEIVPPTADFSFLDFIDENTDEEETIEKTKKQTKGNEKSAAEIIEAKARAVINNQKDKDHNLYLLFSERLDTLLKEIHQSSMNFAEKMKQLIALIKEAKQGGKAYPQGVVNKLQKAFWNNREECGFSTDEPEALGQIAEAYELVDTKAGPDFKRQGSRQAVLFQKELQRAFPNHTEEQLFAIYKYAVQNS